MTTEVLNTDNRPEETILVSVLLHWSWSGKKGMLLYREKIQCKKKSLVPGEMDIMSEELTEYWYNLCHLCRDFKMLPPLSFRMLESICQTSDMSALYLVNSSSVLHPQITSPLVVVFKKIKRHKHIVVSKVILSSL